MPTKPGMGGHGSEAYDPATGKFIEDGKTNVRHPNPIEAQKIAGGVSPMKIQKDSASKMSEPTPNLGDYAKPKENVRATTLKQEFGVSPSEDDAFGLQDDFYQKEEKFRDAGVSQGYYESHADEFLKDFIKMRFPEVDDATLNKVGRTFEIPYSLLDKMQYDSEDDFHKDFEEFVFDPANY